MSEQENRRVVESIFEAFGRGDVPAMLGALREDVEWGLAGGGVPYFGQYRGRDGVKDFLGKLGGSVDFEAFEPREFIASGDKVVVLGRERARVKETGKTFDQEWAMVFTVRDGKVARFQSFEDTGAVAEAFKSSSQ